MIPVTQTKLYSDTGGHHGNCLAAVLASLLEIPLWMVPEFEGMIARRNEYWLDRVVEWVSRMFKEDFHYDSPANIHDNHIPLPEFYIARGQSPRGMDHAVIFSNGKLVHDPHPLGGGIGEVTMIYWIDQAATGGRDKRH
jgi:hypothetical protein